ncbi:MAG: nicotinate-nucleotide adenylyltransferase, partial [Elusimicrobiota bacterium]|nr:nicotinate-nucleotide adenylyltransferase [Elusimicrobiota bacterium]
MKIGLFGGTFNPIHFGHLILAEEARSQFKLDKIFFIPTGNPPHKPNTPLAPKHHRKNTVKLAIKNNKYFALSDYELNKSGPSYSYQTIEHFKKLYPEDEIYFIIGIDLLKQIHSWEKGEKILNYCKFIVGLRPNYSINAIPARIRKKVLFLKIPFIDISSTDIREKIKNLESIKYLTPEPVITYIMQNKLY